MALLAELINNIPQSLAYQNKKMMDFLPDYFGAREPVAITEKSLEQQRVEWAAFKEKYLAAQRRM